MHDLTGFHNTFPFLSPGSIHETDGRRSDEHSR
jgi:hypothetical protein